MKLLVVETYFDGNPYTDGTALTVDLIGKIETLISLDVIGKKSPLKIILDSTDKFIAKTYWEDIKNTKFETYRSPYDIFVWTQSELSDIFVENWLFITLLSKVDTSINFWGVYGAKEIKSNINLLQLEEKEKL